MPNATETTTTDALRAHLGDLAGDATVATDGAHHVVDLTGGARAGTLLVSFDQLPRAMAHRRWGPHPNEIARKAGWTQMAVLSEGPSWFRSPFLTGVFDRRADDEWFDGFDQVLLYGAGAGGYAAAAYAAAAPGARVLAVSPVATLSPDLAPWDDRVPAARRLDWDGPYGFAPDMAEAACQTAVVYDPRAALDAMHAALFRRPGTVFLRARGAGEGAEATLRQAGALGPMLRAAAVGDLDPETFAEIWRRRRDAPRYLMALADQLNEAGRTELLRRVLRQGVGLVGARRFQNMARREGVSAED
ncbi:MAG: hypothetical protein ACU0BS_09820 [Hasllibacter sp.]